MTAPTTPKNGKTDDPFIDDPERVAEIAQRAFGRAKDAALAENKRLGVPSYGAVRDPQPTHRLSKSRTKPAAHAAK